MSRFLSAAFFLAVASVPPFGAQAQTSVGQGQATAFKDTSMLKPPAGAKVAIVEWEDLECPACSKAFPIVHEAAKHYNIPLVRKDFPLAMHVWSHDAAITARYLQDKVSPVVADDFRRQVFATQYQIASKDDLRAFTTKFFASHNQQMPFVMDPTGVFGREVEADKVLGDRAGLGHTPTIVVVTATKWIEVNDVMQLYSAIDQAQASVGAAASVSTKPTGTNTAAAKRTTPIHKKTS